MIFKDLRQSIFGESKKDIQTEIRDLLQEVLGNSIEDGVDAVKEETTEKLSSIFKISTNAVEEETAARVLNSTALASETNAVNLLSAAKLKEMGVDTSQLTLMEGIKVSKNGNLIATRALTEAEYEQLAVSLQQAGVNEAQIASILGLVEIKKLMTIADYQQLAAELGLTEAQAGQIVQALNLSVADGVNITTSKVLTKQEILEAIAHAGVTEETTKEILAKKILDAQNLKNIGSSKLLTKILTLLKNPLTWVVVAVGAAAVAFAHFHDTAEETSEKVDKLKKSFDSALKTANQNLKTIEGFASRYEELSEGVDALGRNISLSNEEFEEYNNIVNQIADMSPELVKGYTSEGNAILSLKGNVDDLKQSYIDAQKEAYNLLISSGEDADGNDIIKQWNDTHKTDFFAKAFDFGAEDVDKTISKADAIKQLKAITEMSADEFRNIKETTGYGSREEISKLTELQKDIGYGSYIFKELGIDETVTDEEYNTIKKKAQSLIKTYQAEINVALSDVKQLANAYLMTDDIYDSLSSDNKNIASLLVNSINEEIASQFETQTDVDMFVSNILQTIQNATPEVNKALVGLFNLNAEDLSIPETKALIDNYISIISEALGEDPVELKIRLGFDDIDSLYGNYNTITTTYAKKFSPYSDFDFTHETDAYKKYQSTYEDLNEFAKNNSINTQNEIALWEKYLEESKTIETAMRKYLSEASQITKIDNIQHLSNIQSMESDLDKIGEIYKDIQDMEVFDYSSILNNEEFATIFSGYTEEYQKFIETISDSPDDIDKCQSSFDDLVSAYINGKGFIEDVTDETKDSTIAMLEQMGVTNANEIVTRALAISKERLRLETGECVGKTYEEILAMSNLAAEGSITQMVLAQLALEKKLINGTTIDTASDVEQIYNLAQSAGASAEVLAKLAWAKQVLQSTGNGSYGNLYDYQQARDFLDSLENGTYDFKFNIDDYMVDYKGPDSDKGSSESATEVLDKYFDYYEKQLQAGQITYQEYVQKCNDIRDKYYKDGKITSAEYYQYLADLYEKELEYHDKAISAVTDAIDDKIDELEKQKEELEDYYNGLIENIQNEIDKLQKANEERERAIALQKAQYELNRALNQRTDYVYQDGQFIYKAKDGAIRDAQNELDDKLFDMQISELEKQIEDLEKALEDATGTIDEQINALNEYKDKWSDISSAYEESQNRIYAASILGADWEADVLDGRLDKLENFKNEYLRIQGELAKASVLGADPGTTSTTGGSSGGSKPPVDNDGDEDESTPPPKIVKEKVSPSWSDAQGGKGYATSQIANYNGNGVEQGSDGKWYVYKLKKYAKGGVVNNDKSPLDAIAHSLNEDHMVAVKTGERILTPIQNSNFEKLINVSADFVKLMKPFENIMKTPDFTKYVKNGNTKNDVVMNVSINCPNVTNESGFNYITKELTSLTTKALQFDWNA